MATAIFRGGAELIAQVDHATPATIAATNTFKMEVTDHLGAKASVTFTATDTLVKTVVEGLIALTTAAKAGGEVPWTRLTVTEDDAKCILTADTGGEPFTLVCTATGGSATFTRAASVACAGPNLLSVDDNYEDGSPLAAADNLIIPADCAYGIFYEDLSGTELGTITFEKGYAEDVACAALPLLLDVADSAVVDLAGTGNIHLGITGGGAVINVREAGPGEGAGTYGMNLSVGEATQVINIMLDGPGGKVSLAALPGQGANATFPTIKVSEGNVKIGSGVTVTDITTTGGVTHSEASPTGDIVNTGGEFHREGVATAADWFVYAPARAFEKSGGNISGNVAVAGVIDASKDLRTRTWATTVVHKGGKIIDPQKTITFTANLELHRCGLNTLDRGEHMDVVFSAVG